MHPRTVGEYGVFARESGAGSQSNEEPQETHQNIMTQFE
jgi:hypothetical protein